MVNKHVFSFSLERPSIQFANEYAGTEHLAGYSYRYVLLKGADTYTLVTKPIRIAGGIVLDPSMILLNPCLSSGITLMLFVNALVHEMIHQDDVENGTLLQRKYDAKIKGEKNFNSHRGYFENFANAVNMKFNLDVKERGSTMSDEIAMSIEAVRKALLEKEREKLLEKEREKLLDESGPAGLSDGEKLKLSKVGLGKDEFSECRYLGHGVFEETLF